MLQGQGGPSALPLLSIGFLSIVTFLGINGHDLDATDAEVISEMLALADRRVSEEELAEWIRQHSTKRNVFRA